MGLVEEYIDKILLYCVFLMSGSFHEAAHAWSSWRLGDPTAREYGRMTLNPLVHIDLFGTVAIPIINILFGGILIGWMKPVPVYTPNLRKPGRDSLFVSLAGPFSNLVLAFAALTVWMGLTAFTEGTIPAVVHKVVYYTVFINLLLAFFNLLPIPPLDGSTIVDYIRRDPNESYHRQAGIGMMILLAMMYLGLFRYLWAAIQAAFSFLLIFPWLPIVLLGLFGGIAILFYVKNRPDGFVKMGKRKKRKKGENVRAVLEGGLTIVAARTVAASLNAGDAVPESDLRWYGTLKDDKGDGGELCATISFDVGNDFCRRCPNLNRCIVRDAENSASD